MAKLIIDELTFDRNVLAFHVDSFNKNVMAVFVNDKGTTKEYKTAEEMSEAFLDSFLGRATGTEEHIKKYREFIKPLVDGFAEIYFKCNGNHVSLVEWSFFLNNFVQNNLNKVQAKS